MTIAFSKKLEINNNCDEGFRHRSNWSVISVAPLWLVDLVTILQKPVKKVISWCLEKESIYIVAKYDV